jgi:hypothetical protein
MALSLGVKNGSQIKVGTTTLRVRKVSNNGKSILIQVVNRRFLVNDQDRTEILPDIFVFCGVTGDRAGERRSRIAFEAPRSIRIDRVKDTSGGATSGESRLWRG